MTSLVFPSSSCFMNTGFSYKLLKWFDVNKRDLPWRNINDPYPIWLSEIILQQTRIQQGTDYWQRFVSRWPNEESLAKATEDEVLREWQGLGYYSRARNLHVAAKQIVELGKFPDTIKDIKSLKGVGDYTAAAIASFAFNIPVAAVDGNVYRVLARHFGIDTPIDSVQGKKVFAELAQDLLPQKHPADFNQAMMDFGAIQCTPHSPRCDSCPMIDTCDALRTQRVNSLPVKTNKVKIRERKFYYYYIRYQTNSQKFIALRKRPAGDIWQGLWEPLMIEDNPKIPDFKGSVTLMCQNVKHVLTHQVIFADCYLVQTNEKPKIAADFIWIEENEIDSYALPRLVELLVSQLPE